MERSRRTGEVRDREGRYKTLKDLEREGGRERMEVRFGVFDFSG